MWTKDVAKIWTNYVPPCRPSKFEIEVCSRIIAGIRDYKKAKPDMLILGSTTEFRELAFEEYCNVVIIDNSSEYHEEITNELKYKNLNETLFVSNWQDINFTAEFDIIVGDLIIGNLKETEIEFFLRSVWHSLRLGGYFLTKSFFYNKNKEVKDPMEFFAEYENKHNYFDPFSYNIYNLAIYCMDKQNNILKFKDMYSEVKRCFDNNVISRETYERFLKLGWQETLKTEFYFMPLLKWEEKISSVFSGYKIEFPYYFWAKDFPFYIINK